jgi:hypothetical protein
MVHSPSLEVTITVAALDEPVLVVGVKIICCCEGITSVDSQDALEEALTVTHSPAE